MIHERASGIVSHSITSGKESLGKPLEQEYLARVCIIPVYAGYQGEDDRCAKMSGGKFRYRFLTVANESKHDTLRFSPESQRHTHTHTRRSISYRENQHVSFTRSVKNRARK